MWLTNKSVSNFFLLIRILALASHTDIKSEGGNPQEKTIDIISTFRWNTPIFSLQRPSHSHGLLLDMFITGIRLAQHQSFSYALFMEILTRANVAFTSKSRFVPTRNTKGRSVLAFRASSNHFGHEESEYKSVRSNTTIMTSWTCVHISQIGKSIVLLYF